MNASSTHCGCTKTDSHTRNEPPSDGATFVSEYRVPKMDCPSEAGMIRMALEPVQPAVTLEFNIPERKVRVFHDGKLDDITARLVQLGLGATLVHTLSISDADLARAQSAVTRENVAERKVLWPLLAINALMFVVEMGAGLIAQSTGLIAESLDMFADAAVYGLALYAVGRSIKMQVRAAHVAGVLQLILAIGVLTEVARRFLLGSEPQSLMMMAVASVALIANVVCLVLISKHREGGAHMKASWIFSANDVVINLGVIVAGALVYWTGSHYPDLVIGTVVGLIVLNGARRILALRG